MRLRHGRGQGPYAGDDDPRDRRGRTPRDVMPALLGAGRRLFDDVDLGSVYREKLGVQKVGARTSRTFRVQT